MRVITWLGAGALVLSLSATANAQCVGDCNNNGVVAVNELVIGVNILLEVAEVTACPSFDSNDNGAVAVNELVSAVNNLLEDLCELMPPTPTPTPIVGPPPTPAPCALGDGSQIQIFSSLLNQTLLADGALVITCGTAGCNCGVEPPGFGPLDIGPGLFTACVKPATAACDPGTIDCDGGTPLGIEATGNTDISNNNPGNANPCTGNADCATDCAAECGGAGSVFQAACAGFCSAGTEGSCLIDADCLPSNGACNGADNVPRGNSCECTCLDDAVGPGSAAGGFNCQLGFNLTVESPAGTPCDGVNILINIGDTCAPLTTEAVVAVLNNANDNGGTLPAAGPFMSEGMPNGCAQLPLGNASGVGLVGAAIFYGSTVGDITTGITVNCE